MERMVVSTVESSGSTDTEVQAVKTALEQIREDQAMGAAWRRCVAALPPDGVMELKRYPNTFAGFAADVLYGVIVFDKVASYSSSIWDRDTPTAALEALADALEARTAE